MLNCGFHVSCAVALVFFLVQFAATMHLLRYASRSRPDCNAPLLPVLLCCNFANYFPADRMAQLEQHFSVREHIYKIQMLSNWLYVPNRILTVKHAWTNLSNFWWYGAAEYSELLTKSIHVLHLVQTHTFARHVFGLRLLWIQSTKKQILNFDCDMSLHYMVHQRLYESILCFYLL
jgi:hypothetical protein